MDITEMSVKTTTLQDSASLGWRFISPFIAFTLMSLSLYASQLSALCIGLVISCKGILRNLFFYKMFGLSLSGVLG